MMRLTTQSEFDTAVKDHKTAFIVATAGESPLAYKMLELAQSWATTDNDSMVCMVDVDTVRTIQPHYNLWVLPAIMEFQNGFISKIHINEDLQLHV